MDGASAGSDTAKAMAIAAPAAPNAQSKAKRRRVFMGLP
jgi:hypothetical protein